MARSWWAGKTPPDAVAVRVLTVNLQVGAAQPEPLVAIARDRADVLVVQELTPEIADRLAADRPHPDSQRRCH